MQVVRLRTIKVETAILNHLQQASESSEALSKLANSLGFQEEKSTSNFYVQSASVLLSGARSRNRTTDTGIFSPLLYRLS